LTLLVFFAFFHQNEFCKLLCQRTRHVKGKKNLQIKMCLIFFSK
jgi:hypothetical protein